MQLDRRHTRIVPEPETVIVVGFEISYASNFFASCRYTGKVTNSYQVKNEETTHHTGLYVCREPRRPASPQKGPAHGRPLPSALVLEGLSRRT